MKDIEDGRHESHVLHTLGKFTSREEAIFSDDIKVLTFYFLLLEFKWLVMSESCESRQSC